LEFVEKNKLNIKFKFSNPQKTLFSAEPRRMTYRASKCVQRSRR